jgi:hypothetical protein
MNRLHERNGHTRPRTVKHRCNGEAGHDPATGRFTPGNQAACGNPFNRKMAAMREELVALVGTPGLSRLVKALLRNAEKGDLASAKVLLAYVVGKPVATVHPDDLDVDEFARASAGARAADALDFGTLPWGFATAAARGMQAAAIRLLISQNPGLGWATWRRVVESVNDPELTEWYNEHELLAVAEQLHAARAAAKAGHAGAAGGADGK